MTSRDRLDDLLSEGRLSAPANERMFDRIYGATSGRRRRWVLAMLVPTLGILAVVLMPLRQRTDSARRLRDKGGTSILVELECERGPISACPVGSPLLFRADGLTGPTFLQAYAEGADGSRTWLFPTRATPAPAIAPTTGPQVLQKGAMLGGHPGRYRVHIVVSSSPLDREAVVKGSAPSILDHHVTDVSMVGQ